MSQPYIGEIRMFGGNFAPLDWSFCNGALLSIADYSALFNLIGTTYGGDGQNTFALPNLQSRVPVHQGNGYALGQAGGLESVTLAANQVGAHNHTFNAVNSGASPVQSPAGALPGVSTSVGQAGTLQYGNGAGNPTTLIPASIGANPGGQPHSNLQPYVAVNFIISLFGIYPSQG
jgi:microcystin-dependent protein